MVVSNFPNNTLRTNNPVDLRHAFYDFAGSAFEIGFQHGRALRSEIVQEASEAAGRLASEWQTSEEKALADVLASYEDLFGDLAPSVLDEIRGIAEGAELSYPYTFFAGTRDGRRTCRPAACTSLACGQGTTADNKVLLGQTKDTCAPLERYRIMRMAYDCGTKVIVLNYPGWVANICLTSNGMAFAENALYATESSEWTAPVALLRRLVVEKSSIDEVLNAIRGLRFGNVCLLIAEATGRLVCVESVAGHLHAVDLSDTAFAHANSITVEELKKYEDSALGSPSSCIRMRNIRRLLGENKAPITITDIQRMLRDHSDYPLSVCRHPSELDPLVTTAAFIANLTELEMWIAIGNPCQAEFKRYAF